MSSILKALRKLEEEKRQAGHSAANFSVDQGLAAKQTGPLLPLFAGIVLGAIMVGMFLLWQSGAPISSQGNLPDAKLDGKVVGSGETQAAEHKKSRENLSEPNQETLQNDVHEMPIEQQFGKAIGNEPVPEVVLPPETIASGVIQYKSPLPAKAAIPSVKAEERSVAVPDQGPLASRSVPGPVNSSTSPRLPDGISLRVSEIYYRDDGASSMAVINDLPVMIGSHVDAAEIKDIRPDSVLVTIEGKVYPVPLTIR
jgi:hypothetical protein